jgi:hypothetical protein
MWVTPPPMIDPRMPSTIVQKIVICTCITDFAIAVLSQNLDPDVLMMESAEDWY